MRAVRNVLGNVYLNSHLWYKQREQLDFLEVEVRCHKVQGISISMTIKDSHALEKNSVGADA